MEKNLEKMAQQAALTLLVERQAKFLPAALEELRANGRKQSHYAWWLFPTEKPGRCEPSPRTYVTVQTARLLLEQAPTVWRTLLEEVARRGYCKVLPSVDHGRVGFFIEFWRHTAPRDHWLQAVLDDLVNLQQ